MKSLVLFKEKMIDKNNKTSLEEKFKEENLFNLPILHFNLSNFPSSYNPKTLIVGKEDLYLHLITRWHDFSTFREYESELAHKNFNSMLKIARERQIAECSPFNYSYQDMRRDVPKSMIGDIDQIVGAYIKIKQPNPSFSVSKGEEIADYLSNVFGVSFSQFKTFPEYNPEY